MKNRVLLLICGACLPFFLVSCGGGGGEEKAAPVRSAEERLSAEPDAENGRRVFLQCATCHERTEGAPHRVGPNLWEIYGADAARLDDFAYSSAMKNSGWVWDDATLDAYLENPAKSLPGGRMAFAGMRNPANRRDLIAFLKTLQ
jgi:cytochrome c